MKRSNGFTLIELLIVVAIIAILAAIAVPNFLEAQTRSKVSRVKSDMRSLNTALESYFVDNNKFPRDVHGIANTLGIPSARYMKYYMSYHSLVPLTTPVSYMSSVAILDPFGLGSDPDSPVFTWEQIYSYQYYEGSNPISWGAMVEFSYPENQLKSCAVLVSLGPDRRLSQGEWAFVKGGPALNFENRAFIYDPTNGTVSAGDLVRGIGGYAGKEQKL